ncbi:MAG: hypothetical protein ABI625_21785, partial [bacterium]
MTGPGIQTLVDRLAHGDRSTALALHALICAADAEGTAQLDDVAVNYRRDHLAAQRAAGRDAEREAGQLSMDQVRAHLASSVLPRLASDGVIALPSVSMLEPAARLRIAPALWAEIRVMRDEVANAFRETGEHSAARDSRPAPTP